MLSLMAFIVRNKTIYLYFDQKGNFWEQLHDNYCDKKLTYLLHWIYEDEALNEVGVHSKDKLLYFNTREMEVDRTVADQRV